MWYRTVIAQNYQQSLDENYQGVYNGGRLVDILPNVQGATYIKRDGDMVVYTINGVAHYMDIPIEYVNTYKFYELNKLKDTIRNNSTNKNQLAEQEKLIKKLYYDGIQLMKQIVYNNPEAEEDEVLISVAQAFDSYTGGQLPQAEVDKLLAWYKDYLKTNFKSMNKPLTVQTQYGPATKGPDNQWYLANGQIVPRQ
jgi:hypothetical protein